MYYANFDYGLCLINKEVDNLYKAICLENDDDPEDEMDGYELASNLNGVYLDGKDDGYGGIEVNGQVIGYDDIAIVIPTTKKPEATKAVYTEEELIDEFRQKIGKLLSDDFDYMAHIGWYKYADYAY